MLCFFPLSKHFIFISIHRYIFFFLNKLHIFLIFEIILHTFFFFLLAELQFRGAQDFFSINLDGRLGEKRKNWMTIIYNIDLPTEMYLILTGSYTCLYLPLNLTRLVLLGPIIFGKTTEMALKSKIISTENLNIFY